jgi:hypothetical protein
VFLLVSISNKNINIFITVFQGITIRFVNLFVELLKQEQSPQIPTDNLDDEDC